MSVGESNQPPATTPQLILGFDYGTRRLGVAAGDTLTRTARGLMTLDCYPNIPWPKIASLIADYSPAKLIVGLPYNMDGSETLLTKRVRAFAATLEQRFHVGIALVDERQSSREAEHQLRDARAAGLKSKRVTHADVDMTAAKILLERWLQSSSATARESL